MRERLALAVVALVVAVACTSGEAEQTTTRAGVTPRPGSRPVIFDYSPTVSDIGALLYLLSHPQVDLLAVTLPATGEAGCDLGITVTLGILALLNQPDIPVACDPDAPAGAGSWPAEFLAGHEALADGLPATVDLAADQRPAHQVIAEVAAASEQPVILLAVAPLTNVARAFDRHPELVDALARVVIMGGAVDVPGNVPGTDAEWNLWIDVPAARQVIESDTPITVVPLDATNEVPVPGFWPDALRAAPQSPAVSYLRSLVDTFPAVTSGFFYLWDELAASVAAGESFVSSQDETLVVATDDGPRLGATVRNANGTSVQVATAVTDPAAFYEHFLATLARKPVDIPAAPQPLTPPAEVDSTSPPEEVLAYWLDRAIRGDEAAGSVVAPDAPWVGLGASPDVFVEGSAPYEGADVELACSSSGGVAACDLTWTDRWIIPNPDLDRGNIHVEAEVVDGTIVAFVDFTFGAELTAAFEAHVAWLEANQPQQLAIACGADPAAQACSRLLVDTVDVWLQDS